MAFLYTNVLKVTKLNVENIYICNEIMFPKCLLNLKSEFDSFVMYHEGRPKWVDTETTDPNRQLMPRLETILRLYVKSDC